MNSVVCSGADCTFKKNQTREHLLYHIKQKIPTRITFEQIHLLPDRRDLLNQDLRRHIDSLVAARRPVLFLPNAVSERQEFVKGVQTFKLYLFGITPCGSKTLVILDNIPVFADVRVPAGTNTNEFTAHLRDVLSQNGIENTMSVVHLLPFLGFHTEPVPYVRTYFSNLKARKSFLDCIKALNEQRKSTDTPPLETASDDNGTNSYYFSKVAREYRFATADWNYLTNYEVVEPSQYSSNCDRAFRIDIKDFKKVSKKQRAELYHDAKLRPVIDKDPLIVGMWDIETYSTIQNGLPPTPRDNYTIFMICSAFFEQHSNTPLLGVCCVDKATTARSGIDVVIECGDETNVLVAHMEALKRMAPDILGAYNGSHFDWPLYREKLRRARLLCRFKECVNAIPPYKSGRYMDTEDSVLHYSFRNHVDIKIDASTTYTLDCVANFDGMIDIDILPVFTKLYPRAEVQRSASLNYFLKVNGLNSKEDMPYKRMFRIYERATKLRMMSRECHCAERCALCEEVIPELDCVPKPGAKSMENTEYTSVVYEDLRDKCCHCGKAVRNARDMADVGYYCLVDCIRPQELCNARTILSDKRELSTMSFVSLFDSFYRADGMKVRNVIGAECFKRNIAFSNASPHRNLADKYHYPGAFVFQPNRGLHSDGKMMARVLQPDGSVIVKEIQCRPISGLDYASLYPSLMMAFNLSPDMLVTTKAEAIKLEQAGYTLRQIGPITCMRGPKKDSPENVPVEVKAWTVRHNNVIDPAAEKRTIAGYTKKIIIKYPGGVVEYDDAVGPTDEQAALLAQLERDGVKTTRIVERKPIYGRDALPGEKMGVFPSVVKKLFDKRVPIKKQVILYTEILEIIAKQGLESYNVEFPDGRVETLTKADIEFNLNKVDAKQKALKILANTFYGETGNYMSPIYTLPVAAGITQAGQENIKKIAKYVSELGFIVHYGDTDSLYLSCPDRVFEECDREYRTALEQLQATCGAGAEPDSAKLTELRIKWWEKQVAVTMREMNKLTELVQDYLLADNGTLFLKMAYEEVGYPTVLCGKKKYFMTAHMKSINFYPSPDKIFIKGIDIIKQGQAEISKQLGLELMAEALSPENRLDLIDIAVKKLRKFYSMRLDPTLFAQTARYKPHKQNVTVHTFVDRMKSKYEMYLSSDPVKAAMYKPPEPGDKFDYVVVRADVDFDLYGRQIKVNKGGKMEYLRVFIASQSTNTPMVIDHRHYVDSALIGIFARFIAYHPQFQPPDGMYDLADKEQYKKFDQHCIKQAAKFLSKVCDEMANYDALELRQIGCRYRKVYNRVNKAVKAAAVERLGAIGDMLHNITQYNKSDDKTAVSTKILQKIYDYAEVYTKEDDPSTSWDILQSVMKHTDVSIFELHKILLGKKAPNDVSFYQLRLNRLDARRKSIEDNLRANISSLIEFIQRYDISLTNILEDIRERNVNPDDVDIQEDQLNYLYMMNDQEQSAARSIYAAIIEIITIERMRSRILKIMHSITSARARAIKQPCKPDMNTRAEAYRVSQELAKSAATSVTDYHWD